MAKNLKKLWRLYGRLYWLLSVLSSIGICLTIAALWGGINWWRPFLYVTAPLVAYTAYLLITKRFGHTLSPKAMVRIHTVDKEWELLSADLDKFEFGGVQESKLHPDARRVITSIPVHIRAARRPAKVWWLTAMAGSVLLVAVLAITSPPPSSNGSSDAPTTPATIRQAGPYSLYPGTK